MTPIPNYMQKTNFRLDIPNSQATDFVINVQEVNLPSISIPLTDFPVNPTAKGNLPGSAVIFEPFTTRILLDEDLKSYTDMYQWMLSIVDYREAKSTAWLEGGAPRTILLHVLNSQKTKILMTFRFFGAFPSMLGEIEFNYGDPVNLAAYVSVTWGYKYFEIERDGVIIKSREVKDNLKGLGLHPSMRG